MLDPGPLRAAALGHAGRGWHVFPLRCDTRARDAGQAKRPAFPDHDIDRCPGTDPRCRDGHTGWEPRATCDPARIGRAWARTPYNIGIACGPSGCSKSRCRPPPPVCTVYVSAGTGCPCSRHRSVNTSRPCR